MISLATRDGRFPEALARLEESLEASAHRGSTLLWPPGAYPSGCPTHLEVPFAFKPSCFREAERLGFAHVLWLDAACVAVRPLEPLFRAIEEDGYLVFANPPYVLGEWAGDLALETLGLTREEALRLPEVNAAAIGLDLRHPLGAEFLRRWSGYARDGLAFRGSPRPLRSAVEYHDVKWNRGGRVSPDPRVRGHRHDQTVAGVLAHALRMRLTEQGLETYSERSRRIAAETVVVLDRGAKTPRRPLVAVEEILRDRDHPHAAALRERLEPPLERARRCGGRLLRPRGACVAPGRRIEGSRQRVARRRRPP